MESAYVSTTKRDFRLDYSGKLGDVKELKLSSDPKVTTHTMVTRSLSPLVFTVEDFLTPEEADLIIAHANHGGRLRESITVNDPEDEEFEEIEWRRLDWDRNGKVSQEELTNGLSQEWDAPGLIAEDVPVILQRMHLALDEDNEVPMQQLMSVSANAQHRVRLCNRNPDPDPFAR